MSVENRDVVRVTIARRLQVQLVCLRLRVLHDGVNNHVGHAALVDATLEAVVAVLWEYDTPSGIVLVRYRGGARQA